MHKWTMAMVLALGPIGCSDDGVAAEGGADGESSGSAGSATATGTAGATATTGPDEGGTNGGSTGSDIDPAACDAVDPAADATFDLALGDWDVTVEGDELSIELQTDCTVTAVTSDEAIILTSLECTDALDATHAVELQIAAPVAGTAAWAVDDAVTLSATGTDAVGGALPGGLDADIAVWAFAMRSAADGSLLAAGSYDWSTSTVLAPLTFEITDAAACGVVEGCSSDDDRPLAFRIAEPGGASLDLLGGRRGALELLDGSVLHIDAPIAHASSSCHANTEIVLLVRRAT